MCTYCVVLNLILVSPRFWVALWFVVLLGVSIAHLFSIVRAVLLSAEACHEQAWCERHGAAHHLDCACSYVSLTCAFVLADPPSALDSSEPLWPRCRTLFWTLSTLIFLIIEFAYKVFDRFGVASWKLRASSDLRFGWPRLQTCFLPLKPFPNFVVNLTSPFL